MVRTLGFVWGVLFLLGGLFGFVPGITNNGLFLGIFLVNTPHGIMHIASGIIFLIASGLGARAARLWFLLFGAFYAGLGVYGVWAGDELICGLISNNLYDGWGHIFLGLVLLLIGFAVPVTLEEKVDYGAIKPSHWRRLNNQKPRGLPRRSSIFHSESIGKLLDGPGEARLISYRLL